MEKAKRHKKPPKVYLNTWIKYATQSLHYMSRWFFWDKVKTVESKSNLNTTAVESQSWTWTRQRVAQTNRNREAASTLGRSEAKCQVGPVSPYLKEKWSMPSFIPSYQLMSWVSRKMTLIESDLWQRTAPWTSVGWCTDPSIGRHLWIISRVLFGKPIHLLFLILLFSNRGPFRDAFNPGNYYH